MKSRVAIVLVTAAVTAFVTSIFWIGAFAALYFYVQSDPPGFAVKLDAPREASVGETITLTVNITNPTDEPLQLGSIDIYDSFLDGFTVTSLEPEPNDTSNVFDFSTFYYSESLAPGASFTVTFTLEASEPGVWTGDVDCCTPAEKFVTSSVTVVVNSPEND